MPYKFDDHGLACDLLAARLRRSVKSVRIRRTSKKVPIALQDVAEEMGVSAATISRAQRRIAPPDLHCLLAMCEWMGKSPASYFVRTAP